MPSNSDFGVVVTFSNKQVPTYFENVNTADELQCMLSVVASAMLGLEGLKPVRAINVYRLDHPNDRSNWNSILRRIGTSSPIRRGLVGQKG